MRTHRKGRFIFRAILFGICGAALITWVVMLLWNWLMPMIFHLGELTYWQALGLLILSKILFGGGHGHGAPFHAYHREKYMKERLREKMAFAKKHYGEHFKPEEKE